MKQAQAREQKQIMSEEKKKKIVDAVFFTVLFLFVSAVMGYLFYRQVYGTEGYYHSDMKAYILNMQGLDSGYSFPYPVLFKLGAFFNLFMRPESAMAAAVLVLNSLSILVMKFSFNHLLLKDVEQAFPNRKWLAGVILSILSVSLFFVSMLYPPKGIYLPGIKRIYLGVFSPNPFHNATYMAARPFAILAFLWYAKLLDVYEDGWRGKEKDYVFFSVFLLLATMAKPSFTIVLVGAAGLIMVWRLIKSKFKNLIPTIQLGICFLPTFADLLYQFKGVFVPEEGEEGGIGFCFGTIWGWHCENIPLAVCLGMAFPLLVLVLNYKEIKHNTMYRFSWQIFAMSFAMAFFLYEKGFRARDFNFSWGYMYGLFFAFVGALAVLIKATAKKERPYLLTAQWLAYLWHLVCGVYYFYGIFRGAMYY